MVLFNLFYIIAFILTVKSFQLKHSNVIKSSSSLRSFNVLDLSEFTKENGKKYKNSIEINNKLKSLFSYLTLIYKTKNKNILYDDLLLGNYNVSYVSFGPTERGNPAGGRFRDLLLYKINGLYQHLIIDKSNKLSVINFITGKLFYFIPFSIILRGSVNPLPYNNITNIMNKNKISLTNGTIEALFESPFLVFGKPGLSKYPGFVLSIGPKSSVILDTPYVDENIRLGLGSRGSYFIFERTFDSQSYDYQTYLTKIPINAKKYGKLFLSFGSIIFAIALKGGINYGIKSFSLLSILLGIFLYTSKGGIID